MNEESLNSLYETFESSVCAEQHDKELARASFYAGACAALSMIQSGYDQDTLKAEAVGYILMRAINEIPEDRSLKTALGEALKPEL